MAAAPLNVGPSLSVMWLASLRMRDSDKRVEEDHSIHVLGKTRLADTKTKGKKTANQLLPRTVPDIVKLSTAPAGKNNGRTQKFGASRANFSPILVPRPNVVPPSYRPHCVQKAGRLR